MHVKCQESDTLEPTAKKEVRVILRAGADAVTRQQPEEAHRARRAMTESGLLLSTPYAPSVDVLGRVDELTDVAGGSVDAATGAALGPIANPGSIGSPFGVLLSSRRGRSLGSYPRPAPWCPSCRGRRFSRRRLRP